MLKVFLLYPDRDFDPSRPLPPNADDLTQDLALNTYYDSARAG